MMKMDLGSGSGSNIFQMNDDDIRLGNELLKQECEQKVYDLKDYDKKFSYYNLFKAKYDHMQELIKELNKK